MPAVSGARRIAGTGSRIDAASESAIAAHTISASGPDQTKNAAGSDGGSHGRPSSASSHNGASDAPRRQAAKTAAGAMATANHALTESGSSAMRASPSPVNAIVPCDSHAAAAVHTSAHDEDQAGHRSLARGN